MKKFIKLMRFKHYIKNGLILLPLIFSGQLLNQNLLLKTFCGIAAFSLLSSVVYIINDIKDVASDREHPKKRHRPIASGEVSKKSAYILIGCLFVASIALNYLSFAIDKIAWGFFLLYFVLNLAYSMGLKNIPIVDIAILVSGFFLRVLYGSALTGIEISKWLYLTVISMSFYLGLGKRRNELIKQVNGNGRKVLQFYNHNFLDKNMYICLALTITFYSLWSVDPVTIQRINTTNMIWTVPLVILICMKYSLAIEGNSDGEPVEVLMGDKVLLTLVGVLGVISSALIYL